MAPKIEFVIVEDGRKIATAPTEAKAQALVKALQKKMPLGMPFDFKVETRQSTTAS